MIYCIGDSFTYGDELANPSKDAWPVILGNMLNTQTVNLGKKACGNSRIVKRVIDTAFKDDADLILVAWTGPNRMEFFDTVPYDSWPGRNIVAVPTSRHDIAKLLTTNHNAKFDLWTYRKWLRDIILTQNLLENQNKKYRMMVSWHEWGPIAGTEDLWKHINLEYFLGTPKLNHPDYETFCYWFHGCPKGPGGHPLEVGHKQIAERIVQSL